MNYRIFVLALLLAWPGLGHEPKGRVFHASKWVESKWMEGYAPIVDGVPGQPRYGFWSDRDGPIASRDSRNEEGEAPAPESLFWEIYVTWSPETNRLYLQELRFDDDWSEDDEFILKLDVSHKDNPEPSDVHRYSVRLGEFDSYGFADSYPRVYPEDGVTWWHAQQVESAVSWVKNPWWSTKQHERDGSLADHEDASSPALSIELSFPLWETLDEEDSVRADLEEYECQIIGVSWEHWDSDDNDDDEVWYSWGARGLSTSDFQLDELYSFLWFTVTADPGYVEPRPCQTEPVDTAVSRPSWGFVKDLFSNPLPVLPSQGKKERE